jgi:hypothetical protein
VNLNQAENMFKLKSRQGLLKTLETVMTHKLSNAPESIEEFTSSKVITLWQVCQIQVDYRFPIFRLSSTKRQVFSEIEATLP